MEYREFEFTCMSSLLEAIVTFERKQVVRQAQQHPKYKFSRTWYIGTLTSDTPAVQEWLTEQFGPHPLRPDAWSRWFQYGWKVMFRDERDFITFQLRYG